MLKLLTLVLIGQVLLLLADEKEVLVYVRMALFLFLYDLILQVVL